MGKTGKTSFPWSARIGQKPRNSKPSISITLILSMHKGNSLSCTKAPNDSNLPFPTLLNEKNIETLIEHFSPVNVTECPKDPSGFWEVLRFIHAASMSNSALTFVDSFAWMAKLVANNDPKPPSFSWTVSKYLMNLEIKINSYPLGGHVGTGNFRPRIIRPNWSKHWKELFIFDT